jgi:hypothetical protein
MRAGDGRVVPNFINQALCGEDVLGLMIPRLRCVLGLMLKMKVIIFASIEKIYHSKRNML